METIRVTADDGMARILLGAITDYSKENKEFDDKFFASVKDKNGKCEVELLINGFSVPVVKTLDRIWKQFEKCVDEEAGKKALAMVQKSGLEPVHEALDKAKGIIIEALIKVGFKPTDDDWYG